MIWPAEPLQNNIKHQTSWNIPSVKVHRARRIKSSRQVKFPFCHLLLVKGAALSSGSKMNKPASSVQALGIQTLTVLLDDPQSVHVWTCVYLYINLWSRACICECAFVCMPYEPLVSRWLLATAGDPGLSPDDDQKSDTFTCSSFNAHSPFSPCHTCSTNKINTHTAHCYFRFRTRKKQQPCFSLEVVVIHDYTWRIFTLSVKITLAIF